MTLPKLTNTLIRSFEALDALHTEQRMQGIRTQDGNPWAIDIRRFGRATAFKAGKLPNPFFNRVVGLGFDEMALIENILSFYDSDSVPFSIEFLPNDLNEELSRFLHAVGFRHSGFHGGFFGRCTTTGNMQEEKNKVVKVETEDQFAEFLQVNFDGFELPSAIREPVLANMRHWKSIRNWSLYTAYVGETPSACAILQTKDNIGYLASAATLPSFRGQGLQRRLLQVRIDAAKQQGCDLVCSQAQFGSTSHHNLQKAGLQLAYTKAIWTR